MFRGAGYAVEGLAIGLLFLLLRLLPLDVASALGGWCGRTFGPRLSKHKVAEINLSRALPDLAAAKREKILHAMWDNIGRTMAEFPHMPSACMAQRITVQGVENIRDILERRPPVIFISGHLGNWEILPRAARMFGLPLALLYRPANNPLIHLIMQRIRGSYAQVQAPKGKRGARRIIFSIKRHHAIGMLMDQKLNEGIAVPFFGREAMTSPTAAYFALKYKLPVIPTYVVREDGARFTVHVAPPVTFEPTGDEDADIAQATLAINRILEGWVRAHPTQWLWIHRRWGKE